MAASLTGHTIDWCRRRGLAVGVTEQWLRIPGGRSVRRDWCGFGDVIAIGPAATLVIQVTSRKNVSNRLSKIRDIVFVNHWEPLFIHNPVCRIVVHGWDQPGGKGKPWRLLIRDPFEAEHGQAEESLA